MVKKTLLSVAIAASVATLAGCNVSSTDKYDDSVNLTPAESGQPGHPNSRPAGAVSVVFSPSTTQIPVATDLVFAAAAESDGTASADVTEKTFPVTTAVNKLAGFSTTAPIYLSFTDELAPASVIANQTVFLIKLMNAKNDASIDALNMDTIIAAAVKAAGGNPLQANPIVGVADIDASYVDLGGIPSIRILPKKPLDAKTKYLVVVTDGVKDKTGDAVYADHEFENLSLVDKNLNMPVAKLNKVRDAIQGWQQLANGFLKANSVPNKSILSYTFTTDGSQDDLRSYAAPGIFVKNNLTVEAAEKLTDSASGVPEGFSVVARKLYLAGQSNFNPTPTDLGAVPEAAITATKDSASYPVTLFNAIATSDLAGSKLVEAAVAPKARAVQTVNSTAVDGQINTAFSTTFGASPAVLLGALGGSSSDTTTRYIQGTIELPDFLGKAELTDLTKLTTDQENNAKVVASAMRADHNWTANIAVGEMLDGALGKTLGTTPPKDVDGVSTNVTYRYPFPEPVAKDGDGKAVMIKAPYLLTLPDLTNNLACSGKTKIPTAIFVHGITSTRAGSAIYAAGLAQACIATVAIDLPVHGIAPADGMLTMLSMDTTNAAKTSSPWAGVAAALQMTVTERHSNIWQNENSLRVQMNYDVIADAKAMSSTTEEEKTAQKAKYAEGGSSGSAFINLQNFGRTHDNLRQAVTDLLNLNASLKNINADLDTDNVFVVGHSLGGIVASAFVAVNNDPEVQAFAGLSNLANPVLPKVKGLILANTGGNITKLLENSPGFGPTIVGGLAKSGIGQGTESFEKFLYVIQAMIDGVDPANTASKFGDIPVQLFTVTGHNGTSQVGAPDNTVPVFDYFADADTNPFKSAVDLENGPIKLPSAGVPTAKSFLAGTQAIKVASGLNSSSALKERTYGVANHSTFADAGASAGANAATAKTNFTDMVAKSIALINGAAASDGAQ